MMSPILPPASMNMAMTRQYSVMTPWIVVTVVSKSSTSWLMETFMTAWSRTITNWARARAESGSQDFMGRLLQVGEPGTGGRASRRRR